MPFSNFKFAVFLLYLFTSYACFSQIEAKKITLDQAIAIGFANNKKLKMDVLNLHISEAKEHDLKNEKLPEINFHTAFHVLTNINQYESGISHAATPYEVPRIKYDFTLSAEIPIFLGGKLNQEERIAEEETEISKLKTRKDERLLRLEIITGYLNVLHLEDQVELLLEKILEDSLNIHQVEALRKNELVTNNEVLRAQLQLSNHLMNLTELRNQIAIVEHQIATTISYQEEAPFHIETKGILTDSAILLEGENLVEQAYEANEDLSIAKKEVEIKQWDLKLVKGTRLPQITGGANYGLSYPNFMFFPPTAFLYRFGMAGVNINIPLSNLYKLKHRIQMVNYAIELTHLEVEEHEEQIRHDVFKAQRLLKEAEEKIVIAQVAIAQAEENYRIVKMKYGNQLSLITELIDADNAYLEAQSRMISLKINKQLKFYQLQYILGNI